MNSSRMWRTTILVRRYARDTGASATGNDAPMSDGAPATMRLPMCLPHTRRPCDPAWDDVCGNSHVAATTASTDSPMIVTIRSICSSVVTSGGASSTISPRTRVNRPRFIISWYTRAPTFASVG